ncbi:uncharacterized protein CIMG_07743 [Coccidioides immitis RS]|uniref:Uncharacterized protein n=1 Tax=Coccidioides immitis (strain RS) TaxID=246410 RepID=J3K407_COCIM|nr:uncharacterized protein CIMG_07743 [Coccidioides immitis RS]EAS28997.3 hypothetical protein CIMG_07743 [Coccidioides immitis RS]
MPAGLLVIKQLHNGALDLDCDKGIEFQVIPRYGMSMVIRNIPVYISKGNRIDFELAEYLGDNTIEQAITVVVKMMKGVFRAITVPEVGSRAHLHTGDQKGGRNSRLVHESRLLSPICHLSQSSVAAGNYLKIWGIRGKRHQGEGLQLIQIFMSESDKPRSCPRANNQTWTDSPSTRWKFAGEYRESPASFSKLDAGASATLSDVKRQVYICVLCVKAAETQVFVFGKAPPGKYPTHLNGHFGDQSMSYSRGFGMRRYRVHCTLARDVPTIIGLPRFLSLFLGLCMKCKEERILSCDEAINCIELLLPGFSTSPFCQPTSGERPLTCAVNFLTDLLGERKGSSEFRVCRRGTRGGEQLRSPLRFDKLSQMQPMPGTGERTARREPTSLHRFSQG